GVGGPPVPSAPALRRQISHPLARARRLIDLWNQAGKFIASPKRPLTRSADVNELLHVLHEVREDLRSFPGLLGAPQQTGSLVLSLSERIPPEFRTLTPEEREAITADWQAGQTALDPNKES